MSAAFENVVAAAKAAMAEFGVPGAAVGVLAEGEEEVAGLGMTSVEHPLDVDAETLFQIGSITKTVTATVVLLLAEQGRLQLDEPLRRTLPDLRLADEAVAERVTLRHLLTHTGGWTGDYFDDLGDGDDALARMLERLPELPQLTPLGEVWSYNNSGFYLAGRAVEVVHGTTFEAAARELVLDPLVMERSFFFPREVMTHRFAVGHRTVEEAVEVARPWPLPRCAAPAGGIVSTVPDLLRYARAYLPGGELLAPHSLATARELHARPGAMADGMGLTWFLGSIGDVETIYHGGATNGQIARLAIAPDRNFAIAVLTNHSYGERVVDAAHGAAFREFLGVERPEPDPIERAPDDVQEHAGVYSAALTDVELVPDDGRFVLHLQPKGGFPRRDSPPFPPPPPAPLAFYAEDAVVVTGGPMRGAKGDFLRGPSGEIEWLRIGGRVHRREGTRSAPPA